MVTLAPITRTNRRTHSRLEILGVFGSGKTTLAKRLAGNSIGLLAERHANNPFWNDATANETLGYLAYDLTFLLQHARLVTSFSNAQTENVLICDWSFASDRLWASMRLGSDFASYDGVHDTLLSRIKQPIGYLYLRQSVDVILARLSKRKRNQEREFEKHVGDAVLRLDDLACSIAPNRMATVPDEFSVNDLLTLLDLWRKGK